MSDDAGDGREARAPQRSEIPRIVLERAREDEAVRGCVAGYATGDEAYRIKQLSAIVESSDDAILSKDLDGIVTSWNRGAERLYGYTAEEMIGQRVHILAPPDQWGQIDEFMDTVARGERVEHVETIRVRKDGTPLDVSVTISPIHDGHGRVVGASAIGRDMTALHRAQRDLEEREARIRLLLDSTAEAIYGLGVDGVCTFCNPACARILGYDSPDEIVGRRMHELMHHSRADGSPYPQEECPVHAVAGIGRAVHASDEVFFRADGSAFDAEYWRHPIVRDGSLEGAVVTFLDITDRRITEDEVRLAADRREHFLAMLSHELRNPLAAVLNATTLLSVASADDSVRERALAIIQRQSQHMARLLDDLLDVSRITRGGIELREEDLDLRVPLQRAVDAVETHFEDRDIELEVDMPQTPLAVRGDAVRLQQIAGNLLTNAAKYSPEGSRVSMSVTHGGTEIVVTVRDEGYGISPDLLPDIFDLFVQNEQGLARSSGGLGVGLALVRQLTELHGGRVLAASEGLGLGSEFRVILPLQAHAVSPVEDVGEGPRWSTGRVVVVEDQDDAREVLKDLLEARGYVVFSAKDGEEAIEVIEHVHPDAALIDIGLPGFDGFAVAERLRANPVLDDVVLVALTGYGTADDIAASRRAGFSAHVTKPAEPDRIERILRGAG